MTDTDNGFEPILIPLCDHEWDTNDAILDHYNGTHRCIRVTDHRLGVHVCDCGKVDE